MGFCIRILFNIFLLCLLKEALCASIADDAASIELPLGSFFEEADEGLQAPTVVDALSVAGDVGGLMPTGREGGRKMPKNYIISDDMTDGEHEIRLHFSGVSAKQTSVGPSEGSSRGLVVHQLSNGRQLLLMIYNGLAETNITASGPSYVDAPAQELTLKECSIDTDQASVEQFVTLFHQQAQQARDMEPVIPLAASSPNLTHVGFSRVRSLSHLPAVLRPLANFRLLKRKCRRHLKAAKVALKASLRSQRRLQRVAGGDTTAAVDTGSSRARRSLNDLFILPGTLWCGNKDRAKSMRDLSGHFDADACCRKHDFCPYNIAAMSTKYRLFNSNFITMSHCSCDIRFRTCLKSSNTGAANLVGRVFFDMVKTECFEFKKEKVCKKRSYWGRCLRYGVQKKAVLRNPLPWTR